VGTGGQQSLLRAVLGLVLLARFYPFLDEAMPVAGLAIAASASAALFAVGWRIHAFAGVLLVAWFILTFLDPRTVPASAVPLAVMVLAHAMSPVAPYGSLDARNRDDPGGGWTLSSPVTTFLWVALSGTYLACAWWASAPARLGVGQAPAGSLAMTGFFLAVPVAAAFPRSRPWAWCAGLAGQLAWAAASGPPTWPAAAALLHLHVVEPSWVPPRRASAPDLVFFDGACGLCHRVVRFAIAEDDPGTAFRFAPLQGALFATAYPEAERTRLGESVVVRTGEGATLTRSAALLRILDRLGGSWRIAAMGCRLLPAGLLDAVYDLVARVRRKLFARPARLCPPVAERLRGRFEG